MRVARLALIIVGLFVAVGTVPEAAAQPPPPYSLATFTVDVTIPLGHRCMGVLPTKALAVDDPLELHGFVLLGGDSPVVLAALDWCEVRNGAYDQWRDALASAAGTTRERVLLSSLHQHDAPVTDNEAEAYLASVGMEGELFDVDFQAECIRQTVTAIQEAIQNAEPVTHLGTGEAVVEQVASNRRVVHPDGSVRFDRGSASGGRDFHRNAPDGTIDAKLKTLSFWNGDVPLLALHAYATHPMSHYGRGHVSADFVGLARRRRQRDDPHVPQIYVSGCSGDVTAGKYNDGSPAMRPLLADRLYQGMRRAWEATTKSPLSQVAFRCTQFQLPFHPGEEFTRDALNATLQDDQQSERNRILAAMGLSSLDRIEQGRQIDLPCVDLGAAQILLFPGESFVGYQLMAQRICPESFVLSIGYGECWPGYVPTRAAFEDDFGHSWRWVGPGCEERIRAALRDVMQSK